MKFTIKITLCTVATLLMMVIAQCAMAQDSDDERRQCGEVSGDEHKQCESDISTRPAVEAQAESLSESFESDDLKSRSSQIREDLRYLQAIADYFSDIVSNGDELDFNAVAKRAGEVRGRVRRLRSLLALPSSDQDAVLKSLELPTDRPQLKLSISALVALIANVIENPLVEGRVLDLTEAAKGRSDLDAIVELSERIKSQSELLAKRER